MRSRIDRYLAASALLTLMCGCIKDYPVSVSPVESTITLRLNVPGGGHGGTRSIAAEPDAAGENKIGDVAVLALTKTGSDWVFNYQAEIVNEVQNGAELIVTARAREMSTAQQFVILANAAAELTAASPVRYENIAAIENRLICVTGGGEWPANNNDDGNFTPFPMYARTGAVTVGESKKEIGTFHLVRMVARIDVTLLNTITDFKLTEACLFNYRTKGYVVPFGNSSLIDTEPLVPTVPANSANTLETPSRTVLYNADASGKILSSIYTFESPAITSDAGKTTGTALVIGGFFGSETVNKSYYRIDFKTADTNPSYISEGILRNHQYNVIIQSVTGSGSGTPLEAYLGGGNQLSAKVEKWDEADQNVIIDDQYFLEVDEDDLFFYSSGGNTIFGAKTNYENISPTQGYDNTLLAITDATWLDVTVAYLSDQKYSIKIATKSENSGSASRTAEVKVKSGNMTKIIKVEQLFPCYPAYPGVIGYDPIRKDLNLDGRGVMVYFKFGSVIAMYAGKNGDNCYASPRIAFNPSNIDVDTYESIITAGVTFPNHDITYIAAGIGDPCKLVGKTAEVVRKMTASDLAIYKSGWYLPTSFENLKFVDHTWVSGKSSNFQNSNRGYWDTTSESRPVGADGIRRNGGWFPLTDGVEINYSGTYLPAAGYMDQSGSVMSQNSEGLYWSNTLDDNSFLFFNSRYVESAYNSPSMGLPIRCVTQ